MTENKNLVAALTRRLGEKEKKYVELEERFHAFLEKCVRLEKQLDEKAKASKIGECIANNEYPIVITGVEIGSSDFCVLIQGRVYSLFYDENGERKMLYFAPKAYYPAERLLECYFVIGTRGGLGIQTSIPSGIYCFQYYNSFEGSFPDWAQDRDCMLPLDFKDMHIVQFHRNDEIDGIKAIAKQINPQFQWCTAIIPGMMGFDTLRLSIPDYKHLKKQCRNKTKH